MAYQKLQAYRAAQVTPSDTTDIPAVSTATGKNFGCLLYVGTAGNVKVETVGGDEVTLVGINTGAFIPVQVKKVFATGTTASNILALW